MKYKPEDYIGCGYYSGDSDEIEGHNEKLVRCRKPHVCGGCGNEIQPGDYALRESGFLDGKPVSCYTCIPCLDRWLDEIRDDEEG